MKVSLILTCAGKGTRAGFEKNKLLINFNGKTVLERTVSPFIKSGLIDEYIVTCSKEDKNEMADLLPKEFILVSGGKTRTQSVKNALKRTTGDIVLIHDGARPFVTQKIIKDAIEGAVNFGSAITAIPSKDTVAKGDENISEYLGKKELFIIQTPQAFNTNQIKKAFELAGDKSFNDDGEVYFEYIGNPHLILGDAKNVKLTFKEDFELLNTAFNVKVGVGFDCHKLVKNRKLILGGIEIPHNLGLLGHSDADVLTHAVMDAILSGAGLRDIGYYFPDTDGKYKDAVSTELLKQVLELVDKKGYKVKSVSAVIMAEKPKLLKYIPDIANNLKNILDIGIDDIGIGATTLEGLGFIGREKGICVHSTATLIEK